MQAVPGTRGWQWRYSIDAEAWIDQGAHHPRATGEAAITAARIAAGLALRQRRGQDGERGA